MRDRLSDRFGLSLGQRALSRTSFHWFLGDVRFYPCKVDSRAIERQLEHSAEIRGVVAGDLMGLKEVVRSDPGSRLLTLLPAQLPTAGVL